jgi:hypothetical protein
VINFFGFEFGELSQLDSQAFNAIGMVPRYLSSKSAFDLFSGSIPLDIQSFPPRSRRATIIRGLAIFALSFARFAVVLCGAIILLTVFANTARVNHGANCDETC